MPDRHRLSSDTLTADLLAGDCTAGAAQPLARGAVLLRGFARDPATALLEALDALLEEAPLRRMHTPGGRPMSVAMSNCGRVGWVSDQQGYRYSPSDPVTGRRWPPMPRAFEHLATRAAEAAGFRDFMPDACLINRYAPGARMGLHRDADERDFHQPIVSVSLGLPATFLFGGASRRERPRRIVLHHGDVVVWGGPARLFHHGVAPLADGHHPQTGAARWNLTLRRAL